MGRQNHRPARVYTTQQRCFILMNEADFYPELIRLSTIWAAKYNSCPKCESRPGEPCRNLLDLRKGLPREECSANKTPHEQRVNWDKLRKALEEKL